jgi:DNA repair exonuclease SbcCD ATPase subunit
MLHPTRSAHLLVVFLSGLIAAGASQAADPAAGKAAAKVMLEKGWDKTQAARDIVDREFAASEAKAPGDPFLLGAHWMALANQNRYDLSRQSLDAFLRAVPKSLPALQAKAWIHTVLKEYKQAMDAAEALAQVLAQNPPPADSAARADHEEAVEFLGRFAGYLELPLPEVVDQGQRKKFEAQLLARFDEPRQKLFGQGKEAVATKFASLQKTAAEVSQESQEAAEAEKQKKLADLEKDKEQLAEEAKKVDEREKKAAEQLKQALDNLNRELTTAGTRVNQLQNQLTQLNNQLARDQTNAQRARQRAAQEQNDQIRQRLQLEAQQAENTARGTQRQIDNFNNQLMQTNANYNNIQQQIQVARAGGAAQGQQFENQRNKLERENKKTAGRQKREEQAKNSSKTGTLDSRARSLSTYVTLPLDELRAALLAKLP